MCVEKSETFGLMKTLLDAHTMGVHASAALLRDCGYRVLISPPAIEDALDKISAQSKQKLIVKWITDNKITRIGVSYRLDPNTAVEIVGRLVALLKREGLYESPSAIVRSIHFAGLTPACDQIDREYDGRIRTFRGGESPEETLMVMGIPENEIPRTITEGCKYDKELLKFGRDIIRKGEYKAEKPLERNLYPDFGTKRDGLTARRTLADAGYLDILSIGSSQLPQSNFGENWDGKANGGGVPVNSEQEYMDIWEAAKPMLVRTYSGTKNVKAMARMYERTINIAWHALSLWWFNELDGRGPNSLYDNLKEHIDTICDIAKAGKPVETNVPHHFAFRGCDDVTYIISAYLSAKMAKQCGVKTFILQNMLNTPRSTWGVQDLAKSRAMLKLVKQLQDDSFRVILQTRAGLDYFKPNLEEAKVQLAAVTAMMDDIDPNNRYSPEIIHVVSYCEALFLATPDILNDSIKITRHALKQYRERKKQGLAPDVMTDDILTRTQRLEQASRKIIEAMEANIPNLYSPEGLYLAFTAGWLPVPELWSESEEFRHAKCWETKMSNGGIHLMDHGLMMTTDSRINRCIANLPDAEYQLKHKYLH